MRGRQTAGCQRCPLRKRFRSREHRACCRLRKKLSVITLSACLTRSKIVDSDAFRAFPFAPPCRALRRRRIINQILTFADLAIASSGLGTCFQHAWDDGRRPPGGVRPGELDLNYRLFIEARQAGTHAEFVGGFRSRTGQSRGCESPEAWGR